MTLRAVTRSFLMCQQLLTIFLGTYVMPTVTLGHEINLINDLESACLRISLCTKGWRVQDFTMRQIYTFCDVKNKKTHILPCDVSMRIFPNMPKHLNPHPLIYPNF